MKRAFCLASAIPDIEILSRSSPMTRDLRDLVEAADYFESVQGRYRTGLRQACKEQVIAATDPWADIEYQSLYLTDIDPANRITLQEPPVKDPMVGVMVLKAARLRGESGLVYCGTPEQLKDFASKLHEYEERGEDLSEADFLECLAEAALANGLKLVYKRLSPEHGGDPDADE